MDRDSWDRRYSETPQLWSAGPNQWVRETLEGHPPGRALDLAAGEGRNAVWLAERGWRVTAVDFSRVALQRGQERARERLGADGDRVTWAEADVLAYQPEHQGYDAVLVIYVHVPGPSRGALLRSAAGGVAPGGLLLVVGHDRRNLTEGVGGPQEAGVLYDATELADDLAGSGLAILGNEVRRRAVETDDGLRHALDTVLLARAAAGSTGG